MCLLIYNGEIGANFTESGKVLLNLLGHGSIEDLIKITIK